MLQDTLNQANLANRKRRKRMLLILIGTLLAGIAIAVTGPYLYNIATEPATRSSATARPEALPPSPPQFQAQQALREQFIQQLQHYEATREPELAGANLNQWAREQSDAIATLKTDAIASFGQEKYTAGLQQLSQMDTMVQQVLAERDTMFAAEMQAASQALHDDHYTDGKLHIEKARMLKADNQAAQDLAQQLETLPALLTQLKAANIARTENNATKEYAALTKAVHIAPQRLQLKQRRGILAKQIREQQFGRLISQGLVRVKQHDFNAAQRSEQQARALYPDRPEVRSLHADIARTSAAMALQQARTHARQAMADDDWPAALLIYNTAAKQFPDDTSVRDGLQLASVVVAVQTAVAGYLKQPERLASPNIDRAAQDTLIQADIFAPNSPSLSRQKTALKTLLSQMHVNIPVFVKSDNQTYIQVRGIGKVGKTRGRTIQLKPGLYTFEGSRPGYKSKLVQLRLPIGRTSFQIEVVCDEHI